MTQRARVPVVVGVRPRVGAGTVAAALHADEADPAGTAADIVVCAGDDASLRRAAALGGAAVLVVVLVAPGPPPSRARQRELSARYGAVVVLPHVPHWAGLAEVPDEAAAVLAQRPDGLPIVLRAYANGLRQVVTTLLGGGALDRARPPALRRVRPEPGRGAVPPSTTFGAPLGDTSPTRPARRVAATSAFARPLGRPTPERACRDRPAEPVLDDEALEAAILAAPRSSAASPPAAAPSSSHAPNSPTAPPAPRASAASEKPGAPRLGVLRDDARTASSGAVAR